MFNNNNNNNNNNNSNTVKQQQQKQQQQQQPQQQQQQQQRRRQSTSSAVPNTRPSLSSISGVSSVEYALDYSPFPERLYPDGWQRAWLPESAASGGGAAAAVGGGSGSGEDGHGAEALPVVVYISTLSGDRRTQKNSRWTIDFLTSKKVPHGVVDLSVHPHLRARLAEHLYTSSARLGARRSTPLSTEEAMASLPIIAVGYTAGGTRSPSPSPLPSPSP